MAFWICRLTHINSKINLKSQNFRSAAKFKALPQTVFFHLYFLPHRTIYNSKQTIFVTALPDGKPLSDLSLFLFLSGFTMVCLSCVTRFSFVRKNN